MFLKPAVLAQIVPVICHVDNEGVVVEAELGYLRENPSDVAIEKRHGSVIGGVDALLVGRSEIAKNQRNLPAILSIASLLRAQGLSEDARPTFDRYVQMCGRLTVVLLARD